MSSSFNGAENDSRIDNLVIKVPEPAGPEPPPGSAGRARALECARRGPEPISGTRYGTSAKSAGRRAKESS